MPVVGKPLGAGLRSGIDACGWQTIGDSASRNIGVSGLRACFESVGLHGGEAHRRSF